MAASQAEASGFQDLLTAASPALTGCGFSQECPALGPPGLQPDLELDEALLMELSRHDWRDMACLAEMAEPLQATTPALPTSVSPEVHPSFASRMSGRPAAVHQPSGAPSPSTSQNVQQSACHALSSPRPHMDPSRHPSASTQPASDRRRRHLVHTADSGPVPKPSICATAEGQPSHAYGPPELSLPRHSLDQPGGWRISAAHPSHRAPAAESSCLSNHTDSLPLPGMPIGASQAEAEPPLISGLLPPEVAQQLAVGQALLQKGQQQLPPSRLMPPAPRLQAAPAAAASVAMPSSERLPNARSQVSQPQMRPEIASSPWERGSRSTPEGPRAHKRRRSSHDDTNAVRLRPVIPHQELAMAGSLDGLRQVTAFHPGSLEAQQHALQGVALARGRHMSEVYELKQKNLQAINLHPDYRTYSDMGGKSLLDIYAAFATSTTSFRLPLLVNGTQQFFSLAMLMQLDMPLLYRQSVAGLAAFASQACHDADSPAGQLFSKGACQSLAIAVCALETPHHSTNLYTQYSMKDSSMRQGQVTGHDIMHRLEQKLGRMRRTSITLTQRRRAQEILIEHEAFTNRLEQTRQAILQDMRHGIDAEVQAKAQSLLPSRILKLSEHAHTLAVLLGLAHEAHQASGRKLFLEVLSPWQFGLIRACLYPVFSDIMYLLKWTAGDEPTSELPPLSGAMVVPRFNQIQMQYGCTPLAAAAAFA